MRIPVRALHPRPILAAPYDLLADLRRGTPKIAVADADMLALAGPEIWVELREAIAIAEALTSFELRELVRRYRAGQRATSVVKATRREAAEAEYIHAAATLDQRAWKKWYLGRR